MLFQASELLLWSRFVCFISLMGFFLLFDFIFHSLQIVYLDSLAISYRISVVPLSLFFLLLLVKHTTRCHHYDISPSMAEVLFTQQSINHYSCQTGIPMSPGHYSWLTINA